MQNIASKNTALNQVASTFKAFNFDDCLVLDYGCGKGMSKEFCEKTYNNCKVFLYDPFHNFDELDSFLRQCKEAKKKNIITCNNVLNVLQNDALRSVISDVVINAYYYCTDIIFKIYEGNRSGIGRVTKYDCFQRNEKTEIYVSFITAIIKIICTECDYNVKRKGQYIICKRV